MIMSDGKHFAGLSIMIITGESVEGTGQGNKGQGSTTGQSKKN
jgi:hypothetical protein